MKIDITNLQDLVPIGRPGIRRVARAALTDMLGCYSVVFVDDEQMRDINHRYLGLDDTTDVIAFSFEDAPLTRDDCAGEIIISAQLAAAEARKRRLDVQDELALYIVHGALHLAGFDDAAPAQAAEMHEREKEILTDLGHDAERLWKLIKPKQKKSRR
ncbi:MAG: rRNA maturation RNase YbeY [Planctomycetota bacterium]